MKIVRILVNVCLAVVLIGLLLCLAVVSLVGLIPGILLALLLGAIYD